MCDSSWHSWIPCQQNRCPSQTCSRSANSKRRRRRKKRIKKIGSLTQRQHWIHLAGLPEEQSCNSSSCRHQSATHSGHTALPACWEVTLSPPRSEILLFGGCCQLWPSLGTGMEAAREAICLTYHRSFRGSYPETLWEDTSEVGGAGTVPQQLAIMKLLKWLVTLTLSFTLNPEDLQFKKG